MVCRGYAIRASGTGQGSHGRHPRRHGVDRPRQRPNSAHRPDRQPPARRAAPHQRRLDAARPEQCQRNVCQRHARARVRASETRRPDQAWQHADDLRGRRLDRTTLRREHPRGSCHASTADLATVDSAVVASVPSAEDSVILAAPDTEYAVKSWKAVNELTDAIGSLLPPDQLLQRVMDIIFEEVPAERGVRVPA